MIMIMPLMVMMIRAVNNSQAACHTSQEGRKAPDTDGQHQVSVEFNRDPVGMRVCLNHALPQPLSRSFV